MKWTEDRIQEAVELAKQHDTLGNLAVTLSQLWEEKVSPKAIAKAFLRYGMKASDYLLGPSPRPKTSAGPTKQANPHIELIRAVQRGAKTLENLCDSLGCTPSEGRKRVAAAREAGYDLVISDTTIAFEAVAQKPQVVALDAPTPTATEPMVFAAISDTHFGAKEMALAEFHEFVDYAYSLGVRHIYHAGDVFEGTYHRGHQYEVAQAGFENQCQAAINGFPQKDGLNYWFITGNHDWNSFHKACGMDPGKEFAARAEMAGRTDIHHLGNTQGRVQMGDLRIEMAHPDGGTSYAKSYKMQKWIEKYEGGNKPHVLIFGHYHSYLVLEDRNVTAMHPGCWKFQGAFEQRKGLQPAVGGAIIWAWRDETGMRFRHEWRRWWPRGVEWHSVD
jgi:predicted phosphodiesterase